MKLLKVVPCQYEIYALLRIGRVKMKFRPMAKVADFGHITRISYGNGENSEIEFSKGLILKKETEDKNE